MSTRPRTPAPATPAPGKLPLPELGDAKVLAAAIRVGSTRLIDNVLLEGEIR